MTDLKRDKELSFASSKINILPIIKLKEPLFSDDATIVFLHPSKTGGTNIDYMLRAIATIKPVVAIRARVIVDKEGASPNFFTEGSLGGLKVIAQNPSEFDCSAKKIDFISGHMPMPNLEHEIAYFKKDVDYIITIRNPIDRELSLANFMYQRNFLEKDHAKHMILNEVIDNLQTRFMAGEDYMHGECTIETYSRAIGNIEEKFKLVTPTEDLEVMMSILGAHFGVSDIAYARGQITTQEAKVVSRADEELCTQIAAKNSYDLKLYEYVKERWENWKNTHIEYIQANSDNYDKQYLTIDSMFYQTKISSFMSLDEIENNQDEALIPLQQKRIIEDINTTGLCHNNETEFLINMF